MKKVTVVDILCGGKTGRTETLPDVYALTPQEIKLRPRQEKAVSHCTKKQHYLLIQPTGSGKTITCLEIARRLLTAKPRLRCVFCVPQTVIATGFVAADILTFHSRNLLCEDNFGGKHRLIDFLNERIEDPNVHSRVLICTHALLARTISDLETAGIPWADELHLVVDEGHHLKSDEFSENQLGYAVKQVLQAKDSHVGISTATFLRADRGGIVPDKYIKQFARFEFSYDEYLREMRFISNFKMSFVYYENSYVDTIAELLRERKKTIIYLPQENYNVSTGDKLLDVRQLLASFGTTPEQADREGVITLSDGRRILNLVDTNQRVEQKGFLRKTQEISGRQDLIINTDPNYLDIIIAVKMAQEGFDWAFAENIIQVGVLNSVTNQLQINGRILRDNPSKNKIEVNILLPQLSAKLDRHHKELANQYLVANFMAMLLEEIYDPIILPDDWTSDRPKQQYVEKTNPLLDILEYSDLTWQDISLFHVATLDKLREKKPGYELHAAYVRDMSSFLGGGELATKAAKKLWAMFWQRSLPTQDRPVQRVAAEIQVLINADPHANFKSIFSEFDGVTFNQIKEIIKKCYYTLSEFTEVVQSRKLNESNYRLARRYDDRLPPDPTRAYPEFKDWDAFLGVWAKKCENLAKKYSQSASAYAAFPTTTRKKVKVEKPKTDEQRYKDYCINVKSAKRVPIPFEEWQKRDRTKKVG